MPLNSDDELRALLTGVRTCALVGASDRPGRDSHRVMAALQAHGWRVLPVNPKLTGEHILGEYVGRELAQIAEPIDLVDIFRRPAEAGDAVDEAIRTGAKAVWLQLGITNDAACARAEAAGLQAVQDRCTKIELQRLGIPRPA